MLRIALNIADLTRCEVVKILVPPVIPNKIIVKGGPNVDDKAVVLECEAEQARGIADVIRTGDRHHGRYPTRVYVEGPHGGWHKMADFSEVGMVPI